jgi:hypothetical protein
VIRSSESSWVRTVLHSRWVGSAVSVIALVSLRGVMFSTGLSPARVVVEERRVAAFPLGG